MGTQVLLRDLDFKGQVRELKKLAQLSVKQFPIKINKIDFIQHGENTTFKLTSGENSKYLLRIHRDGYHTSQGIKEELSWLDRIDRKTEIIAPKPIQTINNKWISENKLKFSSEKRKVTVFKWVEGRQIKKSLNMSHIHKIAKLTFDLHQNTKKTKIKHRLYWGAEGLVGINPFMGPMDNIVGLSVKEQTILNKARKMIFSSLSHYEIENQKRMGLIHADLHFGNFFFNKGSICPIDFDDCGYGFHMYDLAVTLISIAHRLKEGVITKKEYTRFSDHLIDSYSSFSPLSGSDLKALENLKLARLIFGTQWLNSRLDNPKLMERSVPYAKGTVKILKKELKL